MSRNITLSVSDEVFEEMREFPEIKWSEVARHAITERIEALKFIEKMASKSKLSEADALELGRKVNRGIARRLGLVT